MLNRKDILKRMFLAGSVLGLLFVLVFSYCQRMGDEARKDCMIAMFGAFMAGCGAFWPVFKALDRDVEKMINGIFLAGVIRLLIGLASVVIIILFMSVNRGWFLGCYGIFYAAFVMADSWLIICLFQDRILVKDKPEDNYVG